MKLYAVAVNRDDSVQVVSVDVVKETPMFYIIEDRLKDWNDPRRIARDAFGFSCRVWKDGHRTHTTPRAALEWYIAYRNQHRAYARATALQCDKQIASADVLLESLPASNA